jgi:hypothetical protein
VRHARVAIRDAAEIFRSTPADEEGDESALACGGLPVCVDRRTPPPLFLSPTDEKRKGSERWGAADDNEKTEDWRPTLIEGSSLFSVDDLINGTDTHSGDSDAGIVDPAHQRKTKRGASRRLGAETRPFCVDPRSPSS